MNSPRSLTDEELNGLRSINALDGMAKVPDEVRRRLALYGMIEETPKGWRLTRLGNDRLGATLSAQRVGIARSDKIRLHATPSLHRALSRH